MRTVCLCLGLLTALCGCASVNGTSAALPVPDGHHRRPANPYGSVLEGGGAPKPAPVRVPS